MAYDINELIVSSAEIEKRIQDGIEKNRKGNFTVKAKAGEKVAVKLKNHKFRFGCNMFMLDEIPDDKSKNEIYKAKLTEFFNMATVPFYWDATEPEEGKTRYEKNSAKLYRRPPADLCVEFCEKNGLEPREHALCYNGFFPDWLKAKTVEEEKALIEKRMQEISSRYADKIPTIEVTNEMLWPSGKTQFYSQPDYIDFCFKLAEKYFPNNTLCINEWSSIWESNETPWDNYYSYINGELLKGGRIDAIGMQYHVFHKKEKYLEETRKLYDLAQSQADVLEKLYSLWFSYPNVSQIVYWNLVDGYAAFTTPGDMEGGENYYRGGLLRFDMSEKPAYKRLKHLIKEVWTTDETILADKNGNVNFRGFYGEYEVTVGKKTYNVNFDKDGKEAVL